MTFTPPPASPMPPHGQQGPQGPQPPQGPQQPPQPAAPGWQAPPQQPMEQGWQAPPPPQLTKTPAERPPAVAWLIPAAAVLAVVGVFTPWFSPTGTYHGHLVLRAESALYSWKDGKIGLLAPILLVIAGLGVAGLMRGKVVSRFERGAHGPVAAAARNSMIVGVVSLVAAGIAWFLVPNQFDNIPSDAGGSWDGAAQMGIDMSRGPQVGYWLTIVAALLSIVGGALMYAMRDKTARPNSGPATYTPSR